MALLRFGNTSKTGARHMGNGSRAWTTSPRIALTNTCDGWNKAISARPKRCKKACLNCEWISGPGHRVYYGREGRAIIILLGGGSKRRQAADIAAAVERGKRYKQTRK